MKRANALGFVLFFLPLLSFGQPMQVLFFGYVDKQPQSGIAVLDADGIKSISSVALGRNGGEISHDGRFVAFDNCNSSNRGIFVARLGGDSTSLGTEARLLETRLVVPITESGVCGVVRWSPDDKKISYPGRTDKMLHIVTVADGEDRALPASYMGHWHTWSPDGSRIVFDRGSGGKRLLFSVSTEGLGADAQPVTSTRDFGSCETWAPDWSPSGDRIAFAGCDGKLYTIKPDGTDIRQIDTGGYRVYSPRWSLDGQWILFLPERGPNLLLRVPKDGGTAAKIGLMPFRGGPFSVGRVP
jgi:Tol biopolymer transport system component